MPETENLNKVTNEQSDVRYKELNEKSDRTEDETKELGTLKQEYQTRAQKRIDQLTFKAKSEAERAEVLEKENKELQERIDNPPEDKPIIPSKTESITIDGVKHLTNVSLQSMVDNDELTSAEAYKLQQERVEASAADKVYNKIKTEQERDKAITARKEDADKVLKEYPQFNKSHPDFNPSDPLYAEATRIYNNGYSSNPNGLSLAIQEAKKILGLNKRTPDLSNELSVSDPSAPDKVVKKEVPFTNDEVEAAKRMYVLGGVTNPSTGRVYTDEEAIATAKKSKEGRPTTRRIYNE